MSDEITVASAKQMKYALEDIANYAKNLESAAKLMNELAQTLLDVPGADQEAKTSEGFAQIYTGVAEELKKLTNRGLDRD